MTRNIPNKLTQVSSAGHMNVSVRYGDFLFTYILWFEDSSGNQRNVRDTNAFVKEFPDPPGIIGSYFYRYMDC